jgi:superfamily I DNA/RNA helicase
MTVTAGIALDDEQRRAIDFPLEDFLAITGPAGSGKTSALKLRATRAAEAGSVWFAGPGFRSTQFGELALEIVRSLGPKRDVELIPDVRAAHVFEEVGARLFSLDWTEFVSAEIDPEITGLRAPERFSSAAFRLIKRLRGALISPDEFRRLCLKAATEFYAKPPNFADAKLITETPAKYRDSLRVDPAELQRQRERELDLVKILARLYGSYVESLVERGCLTATDAIYEATLLLRGGHSFEPPRFAFVDDAQDLIEGEIALLRALYGERLERVTLAGDARQATRTFAGARGDALLEGAANKIELAGAYRGTIRDVVSRLLEQKASGALASPTSSIETFRAVDADDEGRYVAAKAARLIREGTAPERIAVVMRNLHTGLGLVEALLVRGVPVDVGGAASLFDFPAVQDALATLWALADPYRHEWLLRNLEAPWVALSDASIAKLCAEPADPQEPLFEFSEADDGGRARWDRRRELRLAWNLTHGDVDSELSDEARPRVVDFRAALLRWQGWERGLGLSQLAHAIFEETVFPAASDDPRGRFDRGLIERLLEVIAVYERREPLDDLEDFLRYVELVAEADTDLLAIEPRDPSAVLVLDVEAAKGRGFDHVFVVGAQAGCFPQYYVPDAFLFTPKRGIIPKENVGDNARAARTAKFTYTSYALKLRDRFVEQERRAFYCAATRAREKLYVSASGRVTRGFGAPELLEELKNITVGAR